MGEKEVHMRALKLIVSGLAFLGVLTLGGYSAMAVDLGTQPQIKADVVAAPDGTVRLFHGGTEEAKKLFCEGETVPIYRYYGRYDQTKEVGKVKLGKFVGDQYIDGTVVEGEVKPGDVAMKGSAACLVVPNEPVEK
jgi:hypothetical protein